MRFGISSLVLVSALYLAAGEPAKSASEWEEGKPMKTTIAETYDFFMVKRARKKIGLEIDTEVFTLGIGETTVGYLGVSILTEINYSGFTDDATSSVEKLSNAKYLKKIDFNFSDTKIKRRQNKYGYLKYMDKTDSRYRCIVYAERLGAVLGSEYVYGRLCLNTRHREVEKLDQRLFEFIENLRTDGSGKQLTGLRGAGSKIRSPDPSRFGTVRESPDAFELTRKVVCEVPGEGQVILIYSSCSYHNGRVIRELGPVSKPVFPNRQLTALGGASIKEIMRAKGLSGAEAFQEAKKYIGTNCLDEFERYEERHSGGLETAFAYAQEGIGGRYACGGGYSMIVENARDHALGRCERARKKHGINAPCEILAIGNKIVWEGKTVRSK